VVEAAVTSRPGYILTRNPRLMASPPLVQLHDTKQAGRSLGTVAWAALWCVLAGQLVFATVFVPPWQNPDEPAHLAVVRVLARRPTLFDLAKRQDLAVESEILDSMAAHGWWNGYSEPLPDPFPRTFEQTPSDHLGGQEQAPPLYYLIAARFCRIFGIDSLLGQYYALRIASLLISLLTFGLLIRAAREWFDDEIAYCAAALVALIPEFALIAISVSPDPLVFLAGTFIWWQAGRAFAGKGVVLPIAMMIAAALVAVLSKQLAVTLAIQAAMLGILIALTTGWGRKLVAAAVAVIVILRLAGVLRALRLLNPDQLATAHRYRMMLEWTGVPLSLGYFVTFTWRLFGTAYLSAGWLRFDPPEWILRVAALVFLFGVARGIVVTLSADTDARIRRAALVASLFVVVQVAAIYGTRYYMPDSGAQGRFLYPAIGPFAVICALGLVRWRSPRARTAVCCAAIGLMGVLDLASWVTTVVPAYAYWT
jgi:4-amino-4-deoxy-L-arabinose transferase-like glycosyltransferase